MVDSKPTTINGRLLANVVELFVGKQGRKVAFGIWGFWVGTALRMDDKISPEIWWWVFLTCSLLIGFGTIMDSIVAKLGDAAASALGSRAGSLIGGKANANVPPEVPQT